MSEAASPPHRIPARDAEVHVARRSAAAVNMSVRSLADIHWPSWKAKDLATLLFVVQGGQVLLIRKKRGLGAGKINGPGGRLEPGESPECSCARRRRSA
jgi:hypothetical protein